MQEYSNIPSPRTTIIHGAVYEKNEQSSFHHCKYGNISCRNVVSFFGIYFVTSKGYFMIYRRLKETLKHKDIPSIIFIVSAN